MHGQFAYAMWAVWYSPWSLIFWCISVVFLCPSFPSLNIGSLCCFYLFILSVMVNTPVMYSTSPTTLLTSPTYLTNDSINCDAVTMVGPSKPSPPRRWSSLHRRLLGLISLSRRPRASRTSQCSMGSQCAMCTTRTCAHCRLDFSLLLNRTDRIPCKQPLILLYKLHAWPCPKGQVMQSYFPPISLCLLLLCSTY